jgi:UDP-N-acetylglucosamine 2-epimerase (non-hydrolysing)
MKVCIILGTRPEIIKMSPIIRYCDLEKIEYFIIHTGQHYSFNMDKLFFEELDLASPKYNVGAKETTHGKMIGSILIKIEPILMKEKPDIVLVEGDTNSVLAGALAASKLHIKVGHIEAGLRSYDKLMPEETNRIATDHISDYLFAPTTNAEEILLKEGIPKEKISVTGNTIVDAVFQNLINANKKANALEKLNLKKNQYILVTAHRQENVDSKEKLENILKGLELVHKTFNMKVIYPIHPRTRKKIEKFGLKAAEGVDLSEPVGFLEFLQLEKNAKLILTDSGGVQEESCILKVPCVTLRQNTERPETLEVGSNILAGTNPKKILACATKMINKKRVWENPFGDGKASQKIMEFIKNEI